MNLRVLDLLFGASSTGFAILATTQPSAKAVVLTLTLPESDKYPLITTKAKMHFSSCYAINQIVYFFNIKGNM
jgi:hypothetical protein